MKRVLTRLRSDSTAPATRDRGAILASHRVYRAKDGFEALVPEHLVDRLVAFARRHAPLEWMGLVAVRRFTDARGEYVEVVGIVPFTGTSSEFARVETTIASERAARELLRAIYVDAESGAWAHSHPNHFGMFFSETDRATQRTWSEPWMLGIVVDPDAPGRIMVFRGPASEELALATDTPDIEIALASLSPSDAAAVEADDSVSFEPELSSREPVPADDDEPDTLVSAPCIEVAAGAAEQPPYAPPLALRRRPRMTQRTTRRWLFIAGGMMAAILVRRSIARVWSAVATLEARLDRIEHRRGLANTQDGDLAAGGGER